MKQRILELVWINAVFFAMSLSICANSQLGLPSKWKLAYVDSSALQSASSDKIATEQSKAPDTPDGKRCAIFVFHTDEFWPNG